MFVLNELVLHLLFQVVGLGTEIGDTIHYVHNQMETIQIVLHPHIEGCCDRALFLIAAHMQVSVSPSIGEPMNQPGIPMKSEDDVFVFCEQGLVGELRQSVGMFGAGLQLHQIDYVHNTYLQVGQVLSENGDCGKYLERRRVSTAAHHNVRLAVLIVAGPLPDPHSFGAMHHRLVHGQPLWERMFPCNHHVYVISTAQAVVEDRKEAVGIGGQVTAHDVGLLVDDVIKEAGILVSETIVILLPDMRSQQIVQRRDRVFL
jgi:hypothetical protein